MSVSLSILGSGSQGNCAILASSRTRLMVDAGFSRRETLRRMKVARVPAESLDAILITHEHSDHIVGLPRLARHFPVPVFANARTHDAIAATGAGLPCSQCFVTGQAFVVGDIEITPFTVPHDAADPVAFTFRVEGVKLVIVTDLGYLAANVADQLRNADCIVIESNHDLEMLKDGPYPWSLKQRVLSRVGHLSNDGVGEFLRKEFDGAASHLVLAHLSENNNLPTLARLSAERALAGRGDSPRLHVASQIEPLPEIAF